MRHLRIKMPNSVSIPFSHGKVHEAKGFDETDSLQHEKAAAQNARLLFVLQHRKRYGLHAIIRWMSHSQSRIRFQYRKRYGLHAMRHGFCRTNKGIRFNTASGMDCMQFTSIIRQIKKASSFNTASGMDCMQLSMSGHLVLQPAFQYRKRYGLHAINNEWGIIPSQKFQYRKRYGLHAIYSLQPSTSIRAFQYRKRYGLHAILSFLFCRLSHICFNTASGMDCMQSPRRTTSMCMKGSFNTASGMDCMQ